MQILCSIQTGPVQLGQLSALPPSAAGEAALDSGLRYGLCHGRTPDPRAFAHGAWPAQIPQVIPLCDGGYRGVEGFRKAAEACLRFLYPLHDRQHISEGPRKSVQLPDDQDLSFTKMVKQSLQLRTIPAPSDGLLPEDALAPAAFKAEACAVVSWSLVETRAWPMSMVAEKDRQSLYHCNTFLQLRMLGLSLSVDRCVNVRFRNARRTSPACQPQRWLLLVRLRDTAPHQ